MRYWWAKCWAGLKTELQQCLVKDKGLWIKKYSHIFYETSLFTAKPLFYVSSWKISVMTYLRVCSFSFTRGLREAIIEERSYQNIYEKWSLVLVRCRFRTLGGTSESAHCAGFLKKELMLIPNALADCGAPRINQIQLSAALTGCSAYSFPCYECRF